MTEKERNEEEATIKTIDKLPKEILIQIAEVFGHRTPKKQGRIHLAQFISDSIYSE